MSTQWMAEAVCREHAPDVFFPRDGSGVTQAIAICASCPVSSECLDYAIANHVDHGIWGGKSERERRRIARERRRIRLLNVNVA